MNQNSEWLMYLDSEDEAGSFFKPIKLSSINTCAYLKLGLLTTGVFINRQTILKVIIFCLPHIQLLRGKHSWENK